MTIAEWLGNLQGSDTSSEEDVEDYQLSKASEKE